jgi:hypothetical protein
MILKFPSDILNLIVGFVLPADVIRMLYLVKEFASESFIQTVRSYLITWEGTLDSKSFKYLLCFALRRELGTHDYYYLRTMKLARSVRDDHIFDKMYYSFRLKKHGLKKSMKQKEVIDMIKKALINLKVKRALKFSSSIEILNLLFTLFQFMIMIQLPSRIGLKKRKQQILHQLSLLLHLPRFLLLIDKMMNLVRELNPKL